MKNKVKFLLLQEFFFDHDREFNFQRMVVSFLILNCPLNQC